SGFCKITTHKGDSPKQRQHESMSPSLAFIRVINYFPCFLNVLSGCVVVFGRHCNFTQTFQTIGSLCRNTEPPKRRQPFLVKPYSRLVVPQKLKTPRLMADGERKSQITFIAETLGGFAESGDALLIKSANQIEAIQRNQRLLDKRCFRVFNDPVPRQPD